MKGDKTSLIPLLLERAKQLEIIVEGLDTYYSPNHVGQKTERHCDRQFNMVDSLSLVGSLMNQNTVVKETNVDLSVLDFVLSWNYEKLTGMIENPKVQDKPFLYTTKDDLVTFFDPLLKDLTESDIKVLIAVSATHDIGKIDPEWAKGKLNLEGVEFIAHDYDSRTILENNPYILSLFELNDSERNLVLDLVKLHSLPGQYFFGEGNLAGYQPVLDYSRSIGSENPLKIARIHGLIDVMSALNHNFVKPILTSHCKMSELISNVYSSDLTLREAFRKEAQDATKELADVKSKYNLASNSLYRLMKLTGVNDTNAIKSALSELHSSFVTEFDKATGDEVTWYGTYVANAFGSGLKRSFGNDISEEEMKQVVKTTVKVVAAASAYHSQFGNESYALSSVVPGLMIVNGDKDKILDEVDGMSNLIVALNSLSDNLKGLYLRGNAQAVEVGFKS